MNSRIIGKHHADRHFHFIISKHRNSQLLVFARRAEDKKAGLFFKSRLYPYQSPIMDPSGYLRQNSLNQMKRFMSSKSTYLQSPKVRASSVLCLARTFPIIN